MRAASERFQVIGKYAQSHEEGFRLSAAAVNGVDFRLRAAREHATALDESLRRYAGSTPPAEERYREEADLFEWTADALSAINCAFMLGCGLASLMAADGLKP